MDTLIMLVMLMGDQRYLWFSGITLSLELVCLINNYNHIPSIMIILYCMRDQVKASVYLYYYSFNDCTNMIIQRSRVAKYLPLASLSLIDVPGHLIAFIGIK